MNIPFHVPYIDEDDINAAISAIQSGWTTMGPKTIEFEKAFGNFTGMPHAVAVSSCTAALHLALKVIGVSAGDEVIVPANTFVATAEVVEYCGAIPVFADVDRDTHCIAVTAITQKITKKTKVVIPVHYAGNPCNMDEIMEIAREHTLYIVEDAAHALPSWYSNKLAGTIGHIGCYSFYATKTLSTGEGGMLVTRSEQWAQRARSLRLHGMNRDAWKRYHKGGSWRYDIVEQGYKYNMTDIAASMGLTQLQKIETLRMMREVIAQQYTEAFRNNEALIPYEITKSTSAWHLYPLKINCEALTIDRDEFIEKLEELGIKTSVHFIPLYRFSYFVKRLGKQEKNFPNCEWIFAREISLPIFPSMSTQQVNYVIENVLAIAKKFKR